MTNNISVFNTVEGIELIFYDFQKAFDKINHDVLLNRLKDINFPNDLFKWIKDYLRDRTQRVRIGSTHSRILPVTSGVPQGSSIGPYIFSIFISNLSTINQTTNRLVKFADDCTLIVPRKNEDTNRQEIQSEHENVLQWSEQNKLPLNITKTYIMAIPRVPNFTSSDLPGIERTNSIRYLGILMNSKLKWSEHINNIITRGSRSLHVLRIIKPFTTKEDMISVYNLLIRSVIEYCCPLFVGLELNLQLKLNRLQKRAHKIICGYSCTDTCLEDLVKRRKAQSLSLFKKALKPDHILNDIMPKMNNHNTRILIPFSRTSRRIRSFIPQTSLLYNSIK